MSAPTIEVAVDSIDRAKYKQLANDAIIRTFGTGSSEQQLAEALERCVDWVQDLATNCKRCSTCEDHGDMENDEINIDAGEVQRIHGEMSGTLKTLKAIHVELASKLAEWEVDESVAETLAENIEEFESEVDDLETLLLP